MGFATNLGPEGCETNPIKVQSEYPFLAGTEIDFKNRPYVYVITPKGQRVKWYRSYADYCD